MSSILDALRRIEREEDGRSPAPFDLEPGEPSRGPRRRWLAILLGVLAVVTTVSAALTLLRDEPDGEQVAREEPADATDQAAEPAAGSAAGKAANQIARAPEPPVMKNRAPEGGRGADTGGNPARAERRKKRMAEQRARRRARRQAATAKRTARRSPARDPLDRPDDLAEEAAPPAKVTAAAPGAVARLAPVPEPSPQGPPGPVAAETATETGKAATAWKRPFVSPPPQEEPEPRDLPGPQAPGPPLPSESTPPGRPPVIANAPPDLNPAGPAVRDSAPAAAVAVAQEEDRPHPAEESPTRLSRLERLEELKRRRATSRDTQPLPADAPQRELSPESPEPEEEPAEEVLQRRPTGAPQVRVNFLFYSREPARRRIMVTVDQGSLVTLFEGQSVDALAVERILPNEVHFRYDGKLFAVRPRY